MGGGKRGSPPPPPPRARRGPPRGPPPPGAPPSLFSPPPPHPPGRLVAPPRHTGAASALVVQPDGKLVAAGRSSVGNHPSFSLARYASDGTLDPIFGAGGRVVTEVGSDAEAFALVLQPDDGHLLVAGAAGGDFALAR